MAEESKTAKSTTKSTAKTTAPLSGREVIQRARQQLEEMMGRPVEAVLGMERSADGWVVTVQVVELQRIPSSTDVLGSYNVNVDGDGVVVGYRRTRRYYRNRADEG